MKMAHDSYIIHDSPYKIECECGEQFPNHKEYMKHYEEMRTKND